MRRTHIIIALVSCAVLMGCAAKSRYDKMKLVAFSKGLPYGKRITLSCQNVYLNITHYPNSFGLLGFKLHIVNASTGFVRIRPSAIYLKDADFFMVNPLTLEQAIIASNAHTRVSNDIERDENAKALQDIVLVTSDMPPSSKKEGVILYDPVTRNLSNITLMIQGVFLKKNRLPFDDIDFAETEAQIADDSGDAIPELAKPTATPTPQPAQPAQQRDTKPVTEPKAEKKPSAEMQNAPKGGAEPGAEM